MIEPGESADAITAFAYDAVGRSSEVVTTIGGSPRALAQLDGALDAETPTYLHTDHLATPRLGTDASGIPVWRWESPAFGDAPPSLQLRTVNLRFPGQYFDQETGLHQNWYRDYDPQTGRYVEVDPIGLDGGLNTYLYANANALSYTDPLGLNPFAVAVGACARIPACARAAVATGQAAVDAIAVGVSAMMADTAKPEQCTDNSCPPCTPYAKGTIGYIGPHTDHDHFPISRPHLNLFQVNQNPKDCKCRWDKATPDVAAPPPQPGWVNLNGGFPPLSP